MSFMLRGVRLRASLAVAVTVAAVLTGLAGSTRAAVAQWPDSSMGRNFLQQANASAEGRDFLQQWKAGVERATRAEFLQGWAERGAKESPADLVLLADVKGGDIGTNLDGSLRFEVADGKPLRVRFEPHAAVRAPMHTAPEAHPWFARMHPQTRLVTARTASMYAHEVMRANSRSSCFIGEDGSCSVEYLRLLLQAARVAVLPCTDGCSDLWGNPVRVVAAERVDSDGMRGDFLAPLAGLLEPILSSDSLQFRTYTGAPVTKVALEYANVSYGQGHLAALPRSAVEALMAKEPKRWLPVAVISATSIARHFGFRASVAAGLEPKTITRARMEGGIRAGVLAQRGEALVPALPPYGALDTLTVATTDKDLRRVPVCTTLPKEKMAALGGIAAHLEFGRELRRVEVRDLDWLGGWVGEADALRTAVRRGICKVVVDRTVVVEAVARSMPSSVRLAALGGAMTFEDAVAGAQENAAKARGFESHADSQVADAIRASAATYAVLKKHGIASATDFHLAMNRLRGQAYSNGEDATTLAAFLLDEAQGKVSGQTARQVAAKLSRK